MVCPMWDLIIKKEYADVVVQTFYTKKEAEEEIKNRANLTKHLGEECSKLYTIKRRKSNNGVS